MFLFGYRPAGRNLGGIARRRHRMALVIVPALTGTFNTSGRTETRSNLVQAATKPPDSATYRLML